MSRRITQKDLARELGVSVGTVCLALKNDARISAGMREKVTATAKRLGYMPDPMLASLAAYRRKGESWEDRQQVIGYILPDEFNLGSDEARTLNLVMDGIEERARTLGYRIEPFPWDHTGKNLARHLGVCRARGIRGLLLQTRSSPVVHELEWGNFAVIEINVDSNSPFRAVGPAHFEAAEKATTYLTAAGYRRIGFVASAYPPVYIQNRQRAGYTVMAAGSEAGPLIFEIENDAPLARIRREFLSWCDAVRPDCVLFAGTGQGLVDLLEKGSPQRQKDIDFAVLDKKDAWAAHFTGMHINRERVGAEAMDSLDAFLSQNRYGPDAEQSMLLVKSEWHAGTTAPGLKRRTTAG